MEEGKREKNVNTYGVLSAMFYGHHSSEDGGTVLPV